MATELIRNLKKLLSVQKNKVQQLETELLQIKQSKAYLEEDFFHAIEQIKAIKLQSQKSC